MRARIDFSTSPPRVDIPRDYNAGVDLVGRNLDEGRGSKVAYLEASPSTKTMTYAQLADRSKRAASLWRALGVEQEQRVLLLLPDCCDYPALFLGALRAGVVPIPTNTLLTTDDYAFMLDDSRARAVVVGDALFAKLEPALTHAKHVRHVVKLSELDAKLHVTPSHDHVDAHTTKDDVAFWLYSSGSTGKPKAAVHLHSHPMLTSALYAQPIAGFCESDVVFSAAKLFFAYGLGNSLTFPLSVGATTVLLGDKPTPDLVMRTFRDHKPTVFCGVPTLFASTLATTKDAYDGLRVCTSAGEALPKHTGEAWRARFGCDILDGIGSTEMLHIFMSNRRDDVRYGTTGKPVPGYDVELRDEHGNVVVDANTSAMLWVRGPTACAGYFNQREKSLDTFHGAWTKTGDHYARDVDGNYVYAGRGDDMLKVGGIWVSPFEVESALSSHAKVLEAAVVGRPDADGLVKAHAFVVLKSSSDASASLSTELREFVRTKLAPYKVPRAIEVVSELPKTATGKIQRFKLR